MCKTCGDFNYQKRTQTCNLSNKIALVTGGRIKIGYQIALMLLRNGCLTIVTSRFPKDTALRFSKEKDFDTFKDRLHIYGLDFLNLMSIYEFCSFMKSKYSHLDILINNAAQTIRKDSHFVKQLYLNEYNADIPLNGFLS
jgi:NAD(P)-dependent dehydrogenase (short-subunit alcohol dehydrogenase family)